MRSLRAVILIMLTQFCVSCGFNDKSTNNSSSNFPEVGVRQKKSEEGRKELMVHENHKEDIINFFKCNDFNQMNRFIDKEMKLTILFSIGVSPDYVKIDSLSDSYQYYLDYNIPFWIAEDILLYIQNAPTPIDTLVVTKNPIFDCEQILQFGSFVDKGENTEIMTKSIKNLIHIEQIENQNSQYLMTLERDIKNYSDLESKSSIRVVITQNSDVQDKPKIAVFHFTEKNGKLYLTLLDFESFNCSV